MVVRMSPIGRQHPIVPLLAVLAGCMFGGLLATKSHPAQAQFFSGGSRFELSGAVSLNEVDGAVRTHLQRVKAFLADGQWEEGVETLRQLMDDSGERLIAVDERRYVTLREYCHLQLSSLPTAAIDQYRLRVDPQARVWCQEGIANRDAMLLRQVVERHFASSWGDDALFALGEMELEAGDPAAARACWGKLIEAPPRYLPAEFFNRVRGGLEDGSERALLLDGWYRLQATGVNPVYELVDDHPLTDDVSTSLVRLWKSAGLPFTRLAYPETDLPLADIRARLVLASILEGSAARAEGELKHFTRLHADAQGRMGGRDVNYVTYLTQLLEDSTAWPAPGERRDWPTFAGNPQRNSALPWTLDVGGLKWRLPLAKVTVLDNSVPLNFGFRPRRVAEDNNALLSFHPLIVGDMLLLNNQDQVFAFKAATGRGYWPSAGDRPEGEIYVDKRQHVDRQSSRHSTLWAPRFTMTVSGQRLYARMGLPITSTTPDSPPRGTAGYLICLDLQAQGRVEWKALPEDEKWAFEGSPVVDGDHVYVGMRRSDVRPQSHVACLDAQTGEMLWRSFVCAAETPAHGQIDECTHNLLTLHRGTLFYNTNLGGIAALDARRGTVKWLSLYQRAEGGDLNRPAAHLYRDLTPCVYDRGRVFAAPSDTESVLALDADSGQLLWSSPHPDDAVHILGVAADRLVLAGDRLWLFDVDTGKALLKFPEKSLQGPPGHGRGMLLGDYVYWPTRQQIFVVRAATGEMVQQPIDLVQRGATGGNLLVTDGCLLLVGAADLFALSQYGQFRRGGRPRELTGPSEQPATSAQLTAHPQD
jgi:outer membrane protein assembly factor BamB